jgi:uncharacterized protein HemY
MTDLDPAVRDLLVAIITATRAAEHPDQPVFCIAAACESALRFGDYDAAPWLWDQTAELADRRRCRAADTHELLAAGMVPVHPDAARRWSP